MGAFELQTIVCDFDTDQDCDLVDIDAPIDAIVNNGTILFDLTGDSHVDLGDRDQWLATAGALHLASGNPYLPADANLDGIVDGQDLIDHWNDHRFTSTGKWSRGDWNADGITDGQDFILWIENKFQSSDAINLLRTSERWKENVDVVAANFTQPAFRDVTELTARWKETSAASAEPRVHQGHEDQNHQTVFRRDADHRRIRRSEVTVFPFDGLLPINGVVAIVGTRR